MPGRETSVARAWRHARPETCRVLALAETRGKAAILRGSQRLLLNASGSSRTLLRERRTQERSRCA
jgi:hypothetical protein